MHLLKTLLFSLPLFISLPLLAQDVVVKDGDVSLSYDELAYHIGRWTPQMVDVAIKDEGDRIELLNMTLANKKLALEADKIAQAQPESYWEYMSGLRAFQREWMLRRYQSSITYPDFTELAQEQYRVRKDKVALNPERRLSSHILLSAPPGMPRDEVTAKAQAILEELRAGADFVEMVTLHSTEPGAAQKKGLFNHWMTYGDTDVSPPYSEGVFEIEEVGGYSEPVGTQFGVHIIRLDGIRESSYKTFDEVKDKLIAEYQAEYNQLAMKEFVAKFQMSEDTIIDNEAVEKILAPYKTQE